MKPKFWRTVSICCCLFTGLRLGLLAQGRGPGGPPPGGRGPGGPGGSMGAPNGPGGPNRSNNPPAADPGAGHPANMPTAHAGTQFGPVGRWWDAKTTSQTVGLRRDQQKRMDAIFNANKPAILESYKTLLREQAKLDALSKEPQLDKTKMFAAIDAVNQARSSLQKANTEMLLQIRQEMSPDQIQKLEQLQ